MDKSQTFIFVGRSGSGKGTQLELLKTYLSSNYQKTPIKSIVMGDIFRAFFKKEGFFPDLARDVSMKQGKFQPNFITNALFIDEAINVVDDNSFLFLDGYPRNINQMDVTKELLEYVKRENPIVLNIEVSRESVKNRMLARGRGDDNEIAIESRLDEYDKFILPMLNSVKDDKYFKYFEIEGEGSIEEIHEDIINKIKSYL
jgi:adenylate kinase